MKNKAPLYVAIAIVGSVAFNINSITSNSKSSTAAAPAGPIESQFGPEEGALTMKQRAARANHHNLQAKCASRLSDSLKDPNSMRIVDGSYGARGDRKIVVNLTYTATNSFGGRVKEQNHCVYTL
jgi:hypothetical protein